MDPEEAGVVYEPPQVSDIDTAEDREFAVLPGDGGSPERN